MPGTRDRVRDVTFGEDTATSRTGSGPVNLATIRATVIAAIQDAGYPHMSEGRDPPPGPKPIAFTGSIRT
jgi:hypothetical protein